MTEIFSLSASDTDKLLRRLYRGTRPERVFMLICACGRMGDLRRSASAWNGWRVLPTAKCPVCLARAAQETKEYPENARAQFDAILDSMRWEGNNILDTQ